MSKKGFTIVELAIVLVVIGIILGMAVKGKALVDAARMRAEVTKINKFEAAAYTYYARTNALPTGGTGNLIDNQTAFIDKELLTARDLKNEMSGSGYSWAFYRCALNTDNKSFTNVVTTYVPQMNNICVTSFSGTSATTYYYTNARLVCNIENLKDDDNITGGEGRMWLNRGVVESITSANFEDCDTLAASATQSYAYRVF